MIISRQNHHLLQAYLEYLGRIKKLKSASIARYRSYLKHLLYWAGDIPLWQVEEMPNSLQDYLASKISNKTKKPLSRETWRKILGQTIQFYAWAARYKKRGFNKVPQEWLDGLVLPKVGFPETNRDYVTLDEILAISALTIPSENIALKRDQAAAAFLYLSGMRANAFVSLPMKAVDLRKLQVRQLPELGVRTKNGKAGTTYLFPIPELISIVIEWDRFVRESLQGEGYWFTLIERRGNHQMLIANKPGKHRVQILNRRLRRLFELAGLPYKSAHKFRRGAALWGLTHSKDMAAYKAVSENLMHEDIVTTERFYSKFSSEALEKKIASLGE